MTQHPAGHAATTVELLQLAIRTAGPMPRPTTRYEPPPGPLHGVHPRLAAAEAVAACALHLVGQWAAWQSLNACALAAEAQDAEAGAPLLMEVAAMQGSAPAIHEALAALELLDAAVRSWAPQAHPAVGLHGMPR